MKAVTTEEIIQIWLAQKAARQNAGFPMAGDLAIEDTAWTLDISIMEVCQALGKYRATEADK